MYSFGQLIGPIYGGYVTYLIGYRACCDIVGLMMVLFSILFYILGHCYSQSLFSESNMTNITTTNRKSGSFSKNTKNYISKYNSESYLRSS